MSIHRRHSLKNSVALAALSSALLPHVYQEPVKITPEKTKPQQTPKPQPTPFQGIIPDFHTVEIRSALNAITFSMKRIRARKQWNSEDLDTLKEHRRTLSMFLNRIENATEVTTELLFAADEALEAYRKASIH